MSRGRKPIDWEEVHQRLAESERALEEATSLDDAHARAILRQRAVQLARREEGRQQRADLWRILVFRLGAERYGLRLEDVAQVFPYVGCAAIPESSPELLGMANLRGEIRSVMDLKLMLGVAGQESESPGYILLVRQGEQKVGCRVDHIEGARSINPEQLTVPGEGVTELPGEHLYGVTPDQIIVLHSQAVFGHPVLMETLMEQ